MDPYFFRVEHDLVKSEAFKQLNGSAIKVYLVIGLYSDFGTGWAYPSIRTIAKQGGLSRQTVLTAVEELVNLGLLATSKSPGKSTAYRILHNTPVRPSAKDKTTKSNQPKILSTTPSTVLDSLEHNLESVPISVTVTSKTGPVFEMDEAQFWAETDPEFGPKQDNKNENHSNDNSPSVEIPGTPFRITADGRLLSVLNMAEVLIRNGVSQESSRYLLDRFARESIIKAILNMVYLQKQGRLQNGPGYIRTALEKNYEMLPQVVSKLEQRRKLLTQHVSQSQQREKKILESEQLAAEEASINLLIDNLSRDELEKLVRRALKTLPEILIKRNPSITNPLIRARVYELANRSVESN
jgi:DNA-binding transcriptional regulator YhcF (GntR family)